VIELWTCHFLHWGWQHALLNAVAAVPPIVAMRRHKSAWLFLPFLFAAAPFIALAVRAGFAGEYRGASGLVVAMWVFAGVLLRNRVLLVVIAAKLTAEALGVLPSHDAFATVSIAHYAGAVAGLAGGISGYSRWTSWPSPARAALPDGPARSAPAESRGRRAAAPS
jgi:membrane associated rhomboid family serine protease